MNADWKMIGLAIALLLPVSQSVRAEDGRPSKAALEQMGLSGLVVMSDSDAMSVRGHGFHGGWGGGSSVQVFGNSFATIDTPIGDAHSENGYAASGKHYASGKNGSWAGVEITTSHGKPGHGDGCGGWGSQPGGGGWGDGGMGGGGGWGGQTTVTSVKFFAGGYSSAKAW